MCEIMGIFSDILGYLTNQCFPSSYDEDFDVISSLPPEVSTGILRLLPGKDLLNAASVNKRWLCLMKGDSILRRKVKSYIRHEKKNSFAAALFGSRTKSRKNFFEARHMQPYRNQNQGFPNDAYESNFVVWKEGKLSSLMKSNDRSSLYYRMRV